MVIKRLVFAALIVSGTAGADSTTIEAAMMKYYAGIPAEAISMIRPLAASGDVQAQLVLGNILYSLARSGNGEKFEDPVAWYELAAAQDSAEANYALGAIYNNRWIESRSRPDAARAIVYYQRAMELGHDEAQLRSNGLQTRSGVSRREANALAVSAAPISIVAVAPDRQDTTIRTTTESSAAGTVISQDDTSGVAAEVVVPPRAPEPESAPAIQAPSTPADTVESTAEKQPIALVEPVQEPRTGLVDISLDEVAENCRQYTREGYRLYAESIAGRVLSGRATMRSGRPDLSNPARRSMLLIARYSDTSMLLEFNDVPANLAAGYEPGLEYLLSGIIVESRVEGSKCRLSLKYISESG